MNGGGGYIIVSQSVLLVAFVMIAFITRKAL